MKKNKFSVTLKNEISKPEIVEQLEKEGKHVYWLNCYSAKPLKYGPYLSFIRPTEKKPAGTLLKEDDAIRYFPCEKDAFFAPGGVEPFDKETGEEVAMVVSAPLSDDDKAMLCRIVGNDALKEQHALRRYFQAHTNIPPAELDDMGWEDVIRTLRMIEPATEQDILIADMVNKGWKQLNNQQKLEVLRYVNKQVDCDCSITDAVKDAIAKYELHNNPYNAIRRAYGRARDNDLL